jgi:hypothetical protein
VQTGAPDQLLGDLVGRDVIDGGALFLKRCSEHGSQCIKHLTPCTVCKCISFSNAFSNADGYVRSTSNIGELKPQYSNQIRSPTNVSEPEKAAWHARGQSYSARRSFRCIYLASKRRQLAICTIPCKQPCKQPGSKMDFRLH